uniref:Putative proline rich salivary secreted peptide n=1 Tax=Anopheles marajoara TaxID=58244 RepID=A0A2M4C1N0_9DIPT
MYFLFLIFILTCTVPDTKCLKKSSTSKIYPDDELVALLTVRGNGANGMISCVLQLQFPIYECDKRTRDWTTRCLVEMTNAQLSLDLCGTGKKPDQSYVQRCVRQLKAIGKSCPQPAPVADMADDMIIHNPPPPLPLSPNAPKLPTVKKEQQKKLDKLHGKDVLSL